ncbi:MAG: hypothetical protein WD053_07410 [Gracilimonas sp.]
MKLRIYILTLLFSSLLSLYSFAMTGGNATSLEAEIQPAGEHHSTEAATHDLLFSIHHQSERVVYLLSNNSLLSVESLSEEDSYRSHTFEKKQSRKASRYLEHCKSLEISFTIKKRIFPFHTYL